MESDKLLNLVNEIFAKKGQPGVKSIPKDFADGSISRILTV